MKSTASNIKKVLWWENLEFEAISKTKWYWNLRHQFERFDKTHDKMQSSYVEPCLDFDAICNQLLVVGNVYNNDDPINWNLVQIGFNQFVTMFNSMMKIDKLKFISNKKSKNTDNLNTV